MKRSLRVIALVLALVLCLSALTACTASSKPLKYWKNALERTIQKRFGGELLQILGNALQGGRIEASFGGTDLFDAKVDSARLTAVFDAEDRGIYLDGKMTAGEEQYDGSLYLDDGHLVLSSGAFLGSNTIGLSFDTLSADLERSIFRSDSGTQYANTDIDGETAAALTAEKEGVFTLLAALSDMYELGDEVLEEFLVLLTKHAPHNVYSEDGRMHISVTVDNNVLSRTMRDTRVAIVKDRSACRDLRLYAETLDSIESARSGIVITDRADRLESFLASDVSTESACAFIDDAPAFTLSFGAVIKRTSRVIERTDITLTRKGEEVFSLALDLTAKDAGSITLQTEDTVRTLCWRVTEDKRRSFVTEYDYTKSEDGEELLCREGVLSVNKRSKSFTFSISAEDGERVFGGTYTKGFDDFSLNVDSVTVEGERRSFKASLSVAETADMPARPEYVNIFTISELRYDPISTRLSSQLSAFDAWCEANGPSVRDPLDLLLSALDLPHDEIPTLDEDFHWKDLFDPE